MGGAGGGSELVPCPQGAAPLALALCSSARPSLGLAVTFPSRDQLQPFLPLIPAGLEEFGPFEASLFSGAAHGKL